MKKKTCWLKTFIRILWITGGIQLTGCWLVPRWLFQHMAEDTRADLVYLIGVSLMSSVVLGIWLPIRWNSNWRDRAKTILLLPSNYTPLILTVMGRLFLKIVCEGIDYFSQAFC